MKFLVRERLDILRRDFEEVTGSPFQHFYCPITFRDDDVELCQAHIVNQAFPQSPRKWTVQRKDVDGLFGSAFEAAFVDIRHAGSVTAEAALVDPGLRRRFRPRVLMAGDNVPYYSPEAEVPPQFTEVEYHHEGRIVRLGLKIRPEDALAAMSKGLEIKIERDLRLPALVSLIKAAHLTMFDMLGYRWPLSAAGRYVGFDILGRFFVANRQAQRCELIERALSHFAEFEEMVRPVEDHNTVLTGTFSDGFLFLCSDRLPAIWAMIVFVPVCARLHAVLLPIFEEPWAVKRWFNFLSSEEQHIRAHLAQFDKDAWNKFANEPKDFIWPRNTGFFER